MRKLFLVAAFAALLCLTPGPAVLDKAAADDEEAQTKFFFTVVSQAPMTTDLIFLSGAGTFGKHDIKGGGGFTHFIATGMPPFPIGGHGTWRATKLLGFTEVPGSPYGEQISGVLHLEVKLKPVGHEPLKGTMTVVCNVNAGNLFTGHEEGVTLAVKGGLTFEPAFGGTVFNPVRENDD